jgi:hypothetical protein
VVLRVPLQGHKGTWEGTAAAAAVSACGATRSSG